MNRLEFEERYTSSFVKMEQENISTNESKVVDLVVMKQNSLTEIYEKDSS